MHAQVRILLLAAARTPDMPVCRSGYRVGLEILRHFSQVIVADVRPANFEAILASGGEVMTIFVLQDCLPEPPRGSSTAAGGAAA